MTKNAWGVEVPAGSDAFDPQLDLVELGASLAGRLVVPVANVAARDALLTATGASAAAPLFAYQVDTDTLQRNAGAGWRTLAGGPSANLTLASLYAPSATNTPRVTRNGSRIFMDGEVVQAQSITFAAGTQYTVGTIPLAYAPKRTTDFPTISKTAPAFLRVQATGEVIFSIGYSGTYPAAESILMLTGPNWELP